jgi:hypothetical protein
MNRWFPPSRRRIIRSPTCPYIAVEPKWPRHYTDALSVYPVRYCVVQTQASDEPLSWFWSVGSSGAEAILLAPLYDLNVSVRWTVEYPVGASDAEAVEAQSVLLPNPKASDEPFPVPSVHPTITFENPWPLNSSSATRNAGVVSSDAMLWILTRPIQTPLSFPSIVLLLLCFHDYFELFII